MRLLTALGLTAALVAGCAAAAGGEPAKYAKLTSQDLENARAEVRRVWTDFLGGSATVENQVQSVVLLDEYGFVRAEIDYLQDGAPKYIICDVYQSRNGEGALEFYLPNDLGNHCWGPVSND
jgi:hypothetical protein